MNLSHKNSTPIRNLRSQIQKPARADQTRNPKTRKKMPNSAPSQDPKALQSDMRNVHPTDQAKPPAYPFMHHNNVKERHEKQ
jgi:hypothetical protein